MRNFFITTFVLLVAFLVMNAKLPAQNIVAIKDSEIVPYTQALNGFKSVSHATINEYVVRESNNDRSELINEIISEAPDLILAIGLESTLLVQNEFGDIPIVYCMVMDPENHEFINKKNITGVSLRVPVRDQILKLRTIMPDIKKLGVIYNPLNTRYIIKEAKNTLNDLDIKLFKEKVKSEKSIPRALRKLTGKIDALLLIPDKTVLTNQSFKFIVLRTIANNIPLIAHSEKLVQAGALIAVCPDYYNIGKQTAIIANDILHKQKNSLPQVVEPESRNLIINLKTADSIGINIPGELLSSAKKIFHFGMAKK